MSEPRQRNPRLQISVTPEVLRMLEEISQATGTAKATLVSALLDEALPALNATFQAIKQVKDAPREAQALLARVSNEAMVKLGQAQLEFDDLVSAQPARKIKKRGKRKDDRPT